MDSHFSCKITLSMGNVTLISWIQLDSNSITNTVVPVVGLLSLKHMRLLHLSSYAMLNHCITACNAISVGEIVYLLMCLPGPEDTY